MGIKKGDVYYADLTPVIGSEQGGVRPVLIITHIRLKSNLQGLHDNSIVLLEQVRTIDRVRLKEYIGRLNANTMHDIDHAIAVSFGLEGVLEQYADSGDGAERREG